MFCPNCGQQIPDGSAFCYICGKELAGRPNTIFQPAPYQQANTVGDKLKKHLTSPLFLAVTILVTVATAISLLVSFNIFLILVTIAMWVTYANAKSTAYPMSTSGLKFNYGLNMATFVINWVCVAMLVPCVIIFGIMTPFFVNAVNSSADEFEIIADEYFESRDHIEGDMDKLLDEMYEEEEFAELMYLMESQYGFGRAELEEFMEDHLVDFLDIFFEDVTGFIIGIFVGLLVWILLVVILLIVFNICAVNKFRKFAQSLITAYETNDASQIKHKGVFGWLIVVGVFSMANPVLGAAYIVSAVWVKKLSEEICR